ncbi:unnamed protein product [Allacma fusca]|uniref:Uncharacterized protein n=1 Tax=Allacma fusca TaxID=39272 RepID=A0A8J2LJ02_9HEXA|nr:unnamed protein product [Allacma fusca]
MDALLAKRTLLKRKLTRIKTKIDVQPDIHTAKVQEEQIAILYTEFNQLFDEIISTCPTDEDGIHQDQYDEIAERFDEAKVAIRRILHQLSGVSPSTSGQRPIREIAHGQNDVMVKLPTFDIPTFSGNILEWTSFCDLFTSSIHDNPTLKGSQKLKYLKNEVTGEAPELIAEITISDANYNEAWEMLSKRYKNKRKLISSHLTRLLEMPHIKTENGTDLRRLVDTASSVVRAMKALERPLGDNCDLAMLLISNRLDVETHKLWESKLGRDAMPKLSELLDFLDERAAILHSSEFGKQKVSVAVSSKQNGTNNNKKAIVHQTTVDNTCLLIGFSDASEVASAALVYVRSLDADGNYNVKLVAAKTNLAPLKQISLPRLELTGAVLLVRLMENVAAAFLTKPESMLAYSDSTIVLAWIKGHPKQWDTYVANRVSIIQEFLPHERWRHVPGIQNPADCASRGITSVDLISHPLWWEGPEWLKQSDFPEFEIEPITDESLLEARRKVIVHHIITDLEILHRLSSLTKLQRITAYCKRFAQNCRLPKQERTYNFLSSNEIHLGLIV